VIPIAAGLLLVGWFWSFAFPINKKIWTSSYVLVTTGLASVFLALLVQAIDVKKSRIGFWKICEAFGKNPLFIFVLSGVIPKTMTLIRIPDEGGYLNPLQWFYTHVCALMPGNPKNGSLLYAILLVVFYAALAVWMDRKKVYIRV
jgi:predicted acyltransferase